MQTARADSNAARIVSIGGDVTEILYELGHDAEIAAVDTTSVFPPKALAEKKNVGYLRALSTEGILSVGPTLILASKDAGPPEVVAALKSSSIRFVTIAGPDSAEGVEQRIRAVAAAVGEDVKAEKLVSETRDRFKRLAERRATISKPARVVFLLSIRDGKAMAAGTGTAAHAMIELAGGTNVAAAFEGYKPLSDEAAVDLAPDVILVMKRSQQHGAPAAASLDASLAAMKGLSSSPAVKNKRVAEVDGAALLQFGPRTADAIAEVFQILHPAVRAGN